MRNVLAALLILMAFANGGMNAFAGKLSAVSDSVRKDDSDEKPKAKREKKRKRDSNGGGSRTHSSGGNWLGLAISVFESDSDCPQQCSTSQYSAQPYNAPSVASVAVGTTSQPSAYDGDAWSSRLTLFGGSDFETLDHGQLSWLAQIPNSIGLDTSLTTFRESTPTIRDQLWLGDANLVFEPILGDFRARLGIGFNWLNDSAGTEFGGNLTAGFDWDLGDILALTGEVDSGSLGDADLFHAQISLGWQIGFSEVFAGYNYYDIGGAKLDGTMFGIRFRF